jgi:DNA-binding NarL/FixJ family response regulator
MTIRVLVADDHRVVTDGLRSLIDSHTDMRVVGVATTGVSALRLALDSTPDVVVMDQAMPEMNGTEAAQAIRGRRENTRIIILSMHSNIEHVQRALRAGASGYVLKSSAGDEVVEAIRAVHAGRRYLSPPLAEAMIDRVIDTPEDPMLVLSARERQVLKMLAEGRSIVDIAAKLSLARKTVETYRERTMEKLGVRDLPALVKFAIRHSLVELE